MYRFHPERRRIDWLYEQYAGPSAGSVADFVRAVNVAYYTSFAELYHERFVEDIRRQYAAMFSALNLKKRSDWTIVDIGGGTGFEYDRFVAEGIRWQKYFFIEPSQAMLDQFEGERDLTGRNVELCPGFFEDYKNQLRGHRNKIIVMNSCLHHVIWIEEFLDAVHDCMSEGDLFLVCHEPHNPYYLTPMMLANYAIRGLTSSFLLRRLGLWKPPAERDRAERWQQANQKLLDAGVIRRELKPIAIRRMIDYGVGTKGDWKQLGIPEKDNEGHWTPRDLEQYFGNGFRRVYFQTYRHLGEPENGFVKGCNTALSSVLRSSGSIFNLVLQRTSPNTAAQSVSTRGNASRELETACSALECGR